MKKEWKNKKELFRVVDSAVADFGFEHLIEKVSENEYQVYFYHAEQKEVAVPSGIEGQLKTTTIINSKEIDNTLADVVVHFWEPFQEREQLAIDQKTKYLLSLANEAGSRRFRQATHYLINAYATGVTVAELDEISAMFTKKQVVGAFASEIGPWPLFDAYQLIKRLEKTGLSRDEVVKKLVERFGEKNLDVGTFYKDKKLEGNRVLGSYVK